MSSGWYYVKNKDRVGPVDDSELRSLFNSGEINLKSYVWKKGFENWEFLESISELKHTYSADKNNSAHDEILDAVDDVPPNVRKKIDWTTLDHDKKCIFVKIGTDRGEEERTLGPFSINHLREFYSDSRVNAMTLIFMMGMEDWIYLGEIESFENIFSTLPPKIEEKEKRKDDRKPFIARIFFHDNSDVFEGVCRDISVGGLQVLVSAFPGKLGESISINVHPENSEHGFVASGEIVRVLQGGQGFSLRFKDLTNSSMNAITRYIDAN